jgi:hypothetical protein
MFFENCGKARTSALTKRFAVGFRFEGTIIDCRTKSFEFFVFFVANPFFVALVAFVISSR